MIEPDGWLVEWVRINHYSFFMWNYNMVVDYTNQKNVYNNYYRLMVIAIAQATKYDPIPQNVHTIPKKGRKYNRFIKGLTKHVMQIDENVLLFYEL